MNIIKKLIFTCAGISGTGFGIAAGTYLTHDSMQYTLVGFGAGLLFFALMYITCIKYERSDKNTSS